VIKGQPLLLSSGYENITSIQLFSTCSNPNDGADQAIPALTNSNINLDLCPGRDCYELVLGKLRIEFEPLP